MFKALSGALTFLLILLILKNALPEIAELLVQIITKSLTIISAILDGTNGLTLS